MPRSVEIGLQANNDAVVASQKPLAIPPIKLNSGHTPQTQHICPLCGVTLFETGCGLTLPGKIEFGFVRFLLLWIVLASIAESLFPAQATPAVSCAVPACKPALVKKN